MEADASVTRNLERFLKGFVHQVRLAAQVRGIPTIPRLRHTYETGQLVVASE